MLRHLRKSFAVSVLCLLTACADKPLTLVDYEQALSDAGVSVGKKEPQYFQLIGAKNGYGFSVGGGSPNLLNRCEVYEFDTGIESGRTALEAVKKEGLMGNRLEFNENLGIFCQGDSPEAKKAVSVMMSL